MDIEFRYLTTGGNGMKEPVSVQVDNCNEEYCEVKRNFPAKIDITFQSETESTNLNASVRVLVAGIWVPFYLGGQSKVCDHLSEGKCPLPANTKATFSLGATIPSITPVGAKTVVEVKVVDQTKTAVACTRVPVLIKA